MVQSIQNQGGNNNSKKWKELVRINNLKGETSIKFEASISMHCYTEYECFT